MGYLGLIRRSMAAADMPAGRVRYSRREESGYRMPFRTSLGFGILFRHDLLMQLMILQAGSFSIVSSLYSFSFPLCFLRVQGVTVNLYAFARGVECSRPSYHNMVLSKSIHSHLRSLGAALQLMGGEPSLAVRMRRRRRPCIPRPDFRSHFRCKGSITSYLAKDWIALDRTVPPPKGDL